MFDPFDATQSRDAWAVLKALRDEGPLATVAGGLRYVTRYDEARAALRDTATFSNATGMKAPGVEVPLEDRLLGELDPPRHTAVRRVMVTAMTPKVVHAAEPFIASSAAASARRAARRPVRSRHVVHGRAAEPGDDVPPRFRSRRRRPARAVGQGADGEHVPRAQPHRTGRGFRGRVPRLRGLHRRAHRGTDRAARRGRRRATTCSRA